MEDDPELAVRLRAVRRAARRGARSVTGNRQAVEDAVDVAVGRWQAGVVDGRLPRDPEAWVYRVAANVAKSMGSGRGHGRWLDEIEDGSDDGREGEVRFDRDSKRLLRAHLARHGKNLRGRQREVLLKLSEAGMTLRRAAQELGMDRRSLRRSFKSGLARLKRG